MKRKHHLPLIAEFNVNIDLEKLQEECNRFASKFIDVMTANPSLCMNHEELVKSVYDNFQQINLTEHNGELMEYTADVKERIRRKEEAMFNKPTEDYLNSYFKEIVDQFKAPAMRVRITKLAPGKEIPYHIDYDPTYAVRVIVPIYTNDEVKNFFKRKDTVEEYNLAAGKAYFLNTGFSHAVHNQSDKPRIALMFSLNGQEDLENIKEI
jgi:quercetin dioxygenase-like cupin family protein